MRWNPIPDGGSLELVKYGRGRNWFWVFAALFVNGVGLPLVAFPQTAVSTNAAATKIVESSELTAVQNQDFAIRVLHQDVSALTRRYDTADEPAAKMAALVDLCGLYLVVICDSRYGKSDSLQGYRGRIARRLQLAFRELTRSAASDGKRQTDSAKSTPAAAFSIERDVSRLPGFASAVSDPHWQLIAHEAGGCGVFSYYASGLHGSTGHFLRGMNAGEPFDNGPELVALIEAILDPDFWNSAGGSGVLHYYRPLRILVVRATTQVHEDLTELLERLR
jgi:hypothetical protein